MTRIKFASSFLGFKQIDSKKCKFYNFLTIEPKSDLKSPFIFNARIGRHMIDVDDLGIPTPYYF